MMQFDNSNLLSLKPLQGGSKSVAFRKRTPSTQVLSLKIFIFMLYFVSWSSLCDAKSTGKKPIESLKSEIDSLRMKCPYEVDDMSEAIEFFIQTARISDPLMCAFEILLREDLVIRVTVSTKANPKPVGFNLEKLKSGSMSFDISRPTIIIVHGFLSGSDEKWVIDMKDALLEWASVNVLLVDWSEYVETSYDYRESVKTFPSVAMKVAGFLKKIVDTLQGQKIPPKKWGQIHLIGHSLGAHICGMIARFHKKVASPWIINRVTGLDPAQPCFKKASYALSKTDAPFVDVIHTNVAKFEDFGFGLSEPIGDIDFYVNGGLKQKGCENPESLGGAVVKKLLSVFDADDVMEAICTHGRAHVYFTESIVAATRKDTCSFWGHNWDKTKEGARDAKRAVCDARKCPKMGILADLSSRITGMKFVNIGKKAPYCKLPDAKEPRSMDDPDDPWRD